MLWLALLVVFLILEIGTTALVSVWFVGGSLAAFLAAFLTDSIWIQILVFLAVSAILLFAMRPLAMKFTGKNLKQDVAGAQALVGKKAVVTQTIDNLASQGQVQVSGQIWTARSFKEEGHIPKGEIVVIRSISGVKLMVERESI